MKKVQYILYFILFLFIIWLVAYDYFPDKTLNQETISRAPLLIIGLILGVVRTITRSKKEY